MLLLLLLLLLLPTMLLYKLLLLFDFVLARVDVVAVWLRAKALVPDEKDDVIRFEVDEVDDFPLGTDGAVLGLEVF